MIPVIATVGIVLTICGLFWLNRDDTQVSRSVWVPFVWLFISSSRPISEWISRAPSGITIEDIEGNPLDRAVLTILVALGVYVLSRRVTRVRAILRANPPIIIFFAFCLISLMWSDYPFVVFKHWIRGVGDVVMVLVIVTERNWVDALRRVFTQIAFLVAPLSILFIRYFPELGRSYSIGGSPEWTGVGTDKNALGMVCMIFGSFILWRWIALYKDHSATERRRHLFAIGLVLAMILYLLSVIDSKTALMCFCIATLLIMITTGPRASRGPVLLTVLTTGMVGACYCVLILGVGNSVLALIGRNATLTGRTDIWRIVLPFAQNAWVGAGYENFWIGDRGQAVDRALGAGLNQAHNGYLEIYLDLGYIGLVLLAWIIVTGYRNILRDLRINPETARLKLAFFVICLIYNFTEATFKMNCLVWIAFLWAVIRVPVPRLKAKPSMNAWQIEDHSINETQWESIQHEVAPASMVLAGGTTLL